MKSFLSVVMIGALFWGCTPNAVQPPTISTYNTSSNAKVKTSPSNQKSTTTYPGSKEQIETYKTAPSQTVPPVMPQAPMVDTTIASTPLMIAPLDAPIEQPSTPSTFTQPPLTSTPLILSHNGEMIKIAVLIPQKTIKKYAITSVNSVMSYLLYKNYSFDLNVFNSGDEKEDAIRKALSDIQSGGYHYIIAPVTAEGAAVIAANVRDTMVFIPTLHRSSVAVAGENIVFGGIDYDQQVSLLSQHANERVGTFEDGSALSFQLNALVKKNSERVFYEKRVESSKANFKGMFKGNTSLNSASFYLNTPLVTSSLIASQLRANSIYPHALLSTQINYNPLLLTLTQYEDRDNMFIANSIQRTPAKLEEINTLFGHDIVYDWVNYATSIGADLLATHFFGNQTERIFKEQLINNQIVYNTRIVKPERYSFTPVLE
ncbi:MAG: hypothetical protein KBE79_06090 [Sulfurospirillum sp.]|nr:hypothetical protein [Sulfurospirillum sp.]